MIDKNKIDEDNLYAKVILSSTSKYLHSEALKGGQIISYLGVVDVYFDQAELWLNKAEVSIDCILGTINLYIPRHWKVVNNIDLYCSNINNDTTSTKYSEDSPQLTLKGKAILGTVKILYI